MHRICWFLFLFGLFALANVPYFHPRYQIYLWKLRWTFCSMSMGIKRILIVQNKRSGESSGHGRYQSITIFSVFLLWLVQKLWTPTNMGIFLINLIVLVIIVVVSGVNPSDIFPGTLWQFKCSVQGSILLLFELLQKFVELTPLCKVDTDSL